VARDRGREPDGSASRTCRARSCTFRYRALRGLAPGSVIVSALLRIDRSTAGRRARRGRTRCSHAARRTQPLSGAVLRLGVQEPPGDFAGRLIEAAG
jgi:hypothetical protein